MPTVTPPQLAYPAISVVIPLYNTEKYIGECLDSLLEQNFKDFEVIVVDDCSTDNSPAIVESYTEKFGGRLKLTRTRTNTGYPGFPRNKGLDLSRGEYIFNMDSDDAVTSTALEELYAQAKKFDADVVACEKYYHVTDEILKSEELKKQLKPDSYLTGAKILVTEPWIWENNFEERVKFFSQKKLIWNTWNQLIRRDFIVNNEIKFCDVFCDDMVFTVCEFCSAEKYVVIPNVIYFYRYRENSMSSATNDATKLFLRQSRALKIGINYLDEFLSKREFFVRRPDLKYMMFETFANEMMNGLFGIYSQVPVHALDDLLQKELADFDNTALTSFLFNMTNLYRVQLIRAQQQTMKFNQFAAQAQQRIAQLENELKQIKG